jgi:hypothetical protein
VDNEVRASRKLAIIKKEIRILLINQPQGQKPRVLISEIFLFRPSLSLVPDYSRLSATVFPDQKQRSHTAEKKTPVIITVKLVTRLTSIRRHLDIIFIKLTNYTHGL